VKNKEGVANYRKGGKTIPSSKASFQRILRQKGETKEVIPEKKTGGRKKGKLKSSKGK